ncbi:sugar nucleotide-binding protein [Deinococcus sp. Leaf326]|uniref:sugar nucleotide-binding protein n=1 Tax=Deinococcus sp. Leaf326 TaxID=1736338 RepID=UPI0006FD1C4B|nr:sugar nucleotide-binding protein [Deinococcus sp. Leaf326]KQR31804.1 dTDP-4-dehydrorhamnose reductase [Deinococcus sp. Leaf326]
MSVAPQPVFPLRISPGAQSPLELWLGIECTFNRVGDTYLNQLEQSGHLDRPGDLDLLAGLGARRLRYPVLWEQVAPDSLDCPDWRWTDERLTRLSTLGLEPIATLLHHGSGPRYTSLLDPEFPEKLAAYAGQVARRYPWITAYTPVNEPLTTARFSGLYGVWYPHHTSDESFVRMVLNECRGTVLAMQAIREVQPLAQLVQTDDLGRAQATAAMQPEADFQNERRWLAYDLLCGRVGPAHPLWAYLLASGAATEELLWFGDHPCAPDIIGVDYYVTSERFLDEQAEQYPERFRNATHADIEAVRICHQTVGLGALLRETWERYDLPVAVTEVHLGCTREEQLRWFEMVWRAAEGARAGGADIRAVTSWAALGSFDWNTLHTSFGGYYEPGAFDVRAGTPRPTALAGLLRTRAAGGVPDHPTLAAPGFWERPERLFYPPVGSPAPAARLPPARPLLILGAGFLARSLAQLCRERGLAYRQWPSEVLNAPWAEILGAFGEAGRPWAVVNASGYGQIDEAERRARQFFQTHVVGQTRWASACAAQGAQFLTFSSDQVFAGESGAPYTERGTPSPVNAYGRAQWQAERRVLDACPGALVVRSSGLFGVRESRDFLSEALGTLQGGGQVHLDLDHHFSPTYLPDLVHASLDLLIDGESGLWHLVNQGESTWGDLVGTLAERLGLSRQQVRPLTALPQRQVPRPRYSVLRSTRGQLLPSLGQALDHYWTHELTPLFL